MHVERAAGSGVQQRALQQGPVIEGEQEVGPHFADRLDDGRDIRIVRRDDAQPVLGCRGSDAAKPSRLVRIVGDRDHQGNFNSGGDERLQTAHPDVVIGKYDCACSRHFSLPLFCSSSAATV